MTIRDTGARSKPIFHNIRKPDSLTGFVRTALANTSRILNTRKFPTPLKLKPEFPSKRSLKSRDINKILDVLPQTVEPKKTDF